MAPIASSVSLFVSLPIVRATALFNPSFCAVFLSLSNTRRKWQVVHCCGYVFDDVTVRRLIQSNRNAVLQKSLNALVRWFDRGLMIFPISLPTP